MTDKQEFAHLAGLVARNRDREAFARLFNYFAPRLNGYLQKLGLDQGMAEEMTQEVMSVLWHKAHLFDPAKSSLSTWLFRVARNRRIDAVRRDRSHLIDAADPLLQPDSPQPADNQMEAVERDARVRAAMKDLPPEQARLVHLAFFEGLTHSQIAEHEDLPPGTVKSRFRLAFNKLRIALGDDGPD